MVGRETLLDDVPQFAAVLRDVEPATEADLLELLSRIADRQDKLEARLDAMTQEIGNNVMNESELRMYVINQGKALTDVLRHLGARKKDI